MSDLLDIIVGVGEAFASWRFYICFVPALVIAGVLSHYIADQHLAVTLAALSVAFGAVLGIVWEFRRA